MSKVALPLGQGKTLVIETDTITIGKSHSLAKSITAIKKKHSPLTEFPLKENETIQQWEKRVAPELAKPKHDLNRQPLPDGEVEDSDAYLDRILEVEIANTDLYFDVLELLCNEFDERGKLTSEAFDGVNLEAAVYFMREVMAKARIDLDDVFPKRFQLK